MTFAEEVMEGEGMDGEGMDGEGMDGGMDGGMGGDAQEGLYAIRFQNELTAVSGLQFLASPGSIGLDNVHVVAIEDSAFRSVPSGKRREGGG